MRIPSFARCSGVVYVMVRPLSRTTPRAGVPSPAMARRIVDLPAPFVPSSASTSPLRTSKPTSKSTCTGPYEKSTSATCRAGISVGCLLLARVLGHLLPELGDDEREVVADERVRRG